MLAETCNCIFIYFNIKLITLDGIAIHYCNKLSHFIKYRQFLARLLAHKTYYFIQLRPTDDDNDYDTFRFFPIVSRRIPE